MADLKFPPSQKMYVDLTGRMGLAPRWFGDEGDTIMQYPQYRSIGEDGQMAAGIYNSDRRYGFMCPPNAGFATITESDAGTNFTNEIRVSIYDPASTSFYMGENGNLLWGASASGAATSTTNWRNTLSGAIAGSNVALTDLEIYQINGVRKVFFSYDRSSSGGGDIGIFSPIADGGVSSNNDTWLSATVSGAFTLGQVNDHFMVVADNGYMYVGDGNYVHKIDGTALTGGTNGTATQQVLVTSPSFVFADAVDFKGATWFVVIDTPLTTGDSTAFAGNTCGIYVWDRQTTIANMEDFIPIKGVRNIKKIYITQAGKVRILCMSAKRTVQIREYNGAVFETISESALVSYPNYRDAVSVIGGVVYWLGGDARIYAHGYIVPGESDQLYIIGDATAVPVSTFTTGAILFFDVNSNFTKAETGLIISINDNGTIKNRYWKPNVTGNGASQGNVYSLVKYFPFPSKVNYVRIYHNAGNTSGSTVQGTLNIYLNQATSAQKTANITRDDINKGWKYIPVNQGAKNAVYAIQVSITWSTIVSMADATDWMPKTLEIDYTPLSKLL